MYAESDRALAIILNARESRARQKLDLVRKTGLSVISAGLNTPGWPRLTRRNVHALHHGLNMLADGLSRAGIPVGHVDAHYTVAGPFVFLAVNAPAPAVKAVCLSIEESGSFGRVLDLDVVDSSGCSVSRSDLNRPGRRCFLCDRPAFECSRARSHSSGQIEAWVEGAIQAAIGRTPGQFDSISAYTRVAFESALREVETHPKPGLVTPLSRGSHDDMDYDLFVRSAKAIAPYFEGFLKAGYELPRFLGEGALFSHLRLIGLEAEQAMFEATAGVNTHKGLIFSMGLLCGAVGRHLRAFSETRPPVGAWSAVEICRAAGQIAGHAVTEPGPEHSSHSGLTHGERVNQLYGLGGIRAEAAGGFDSVRVFGLPAYRKALQSGCAQNEARVHTLISLMANVADTNVAARGGMEGLAFVQREAARILSLGGAATGAGMDAIYAFDGELVKRGLSPGGAADLLTVTLFLHRVETEMTPSVLL